MKKIYTIQYLRAVAALAVVTLHTGKRAGESLPDAVAHWLPLGNAGVDLFFVISGFIMWSISHRGESEPVDFLMRRAIRVAPPYWLATLAWVLFVTVAGYDWITVTPADVLRSMAFVPHYSSTFPEHIWPVLVPGWTLNFEMFFYLIFAAMLLVPDRLRLGTMGAAFALLVALGALRMPQSAWAVTYSSPLLLEFLGGCFAAALWAWRPGGLLRNGLAIAAGLALLLAFGADVDPADWWQRTLIYGSAGVLIVSGFAGLGDAVPRLPHLERLGDASYAIYLFHLLLVMPLAEIWQRLPGLHTPLTALAFVAGTLVLVSLMGLAIFRYVERPLQRSLNGLLLPRSRALHARLARRW